MFLKVTEFWGLKFQGSETKVDAQACNVWKYMRFGTYMLRLNLHRDPIWT